VIRPLIIAAIASTALTGVGTLMPRDDMRRSVIASDNGRFERVKWVDNDGWHVTVVDHVKGVVLVQELTDSNVASFAVGSLDDIRNHGFRASLRTRGGFSEWDRSLSLYPRGE
jgi:hypothetical protein